MATVHYCLEVCISGSRSLKVARQVWCMKKEQTQTVFIMYRMFRISILCNSNDFFFISGSDIGMKRPMRLSSPNLTRGMYETFQWYRNCKYLKQTGEMSVQICLTNILIYIWFILSSPPTTKKNKNKNTIKIFWWIYFQVIYTWNVFLDTVTHVIDLFVFFSLFQIYITFYHSVTSRKYSMKIMEF